MINIFAQSKSISFICPQETEAQGVKQLSLGHKSYK